MSGTNIPRWFAVLVILWTAVARTLKSKWFWIGVLVITVAYLLLRR